MINLTSFKCTNEKFLRYIDDKIYEVVKSNDLENKDEVIYISAPMTGIDNYSERFQVMSNWINYAYHEQNIFIINPSKYIDEIPLELNASYIDKVFFTFRLINLATIFILDDSTDKWTESRGCLLELIYAWYNRINMYGYNYIMNSVKFRHYLDGHSDKRVYLELENSFINYETVY